MIKGFRCRNLSDSIALEKLGLQLSAGPQGFIPRCNFFGVHNLLVAGILV